jgi:hypothetical protein
MDKKKDQKSSISIMPVSTNDAKPIEMEGDDWQLVLADAQINTYQPGEIVLKVCEALLEV